MARIDARRGEDGQVRLEVALDQAVSGQARLVVSGRSQVKDRRAINTSKTLVDRRVVLKGGRGAIELPNGLNGFTFNGSKLAVVLEATVNFKGENLHRGPLVLDWQPRSVTGVQQGAACAEVVDPKDRFNLIANLMALSARDRMTAIWVGVVGGLLALVNAIIGLHDQFVAESATWLYSHVSSDGDGQSPLFNSGAVSGGVGTVVWMIIKHQLRKYATLSLRKGVAARPGGSLQVAELIRGKPRVALKRAELRVVAYNLECGQYKRGSGTSERTVSFREPVRAVTLYRKMVPYIPAQGRLEAYFDGTVSFDPLFQSLYPPMMLGRHHGVACRWEVQLVHPRFVDHELVSADDHMRFEDFIGG